MISIAMATFNGERYIKEQIDSILSQSISNIELIICDDMSTDKTIDIIKSFDDSRIKLYINEFRLGVSRNFEKAISLCTGDYFALADQDDIWVNNKLEIQLNKYKYLREYNKQKPLLIYHDLTLIDATGNITDQSLWQKLNFKNKNSIPHKILINIHTGCTFFFDKVSRDYYLPLLSYDLLHDHQIAIITFLQGELYPLEQQLVRFRRHNSNETSTESFTIKNRISKFFKELFNETYLIHEIKFAGKLLIYLKEELTQSQIKEIKFINSLQKKPVIFKKLYTIYLNNFYFKK